MGETKTAQELLETYESHGTGLCLSHLQGEILSQNEHRSWEPGTYVFLPEKPSPESHASMTYTFLEGTNGATLVDRVAEPLLRASGFDEANGAVRAIRAMGGDAVVVPIRSDNPNVLAPVVYDIYEHNHVYQG